MATFIHRIKTVKPIANNPKKGFFDFLKAKPKAPSPDAASDKTYINKMGPNLPHESVEPPICAQCQHPMELIIQMDDKRITPKPIMVFQCQQGEGCCDWEADDGANKVLLVDSLSSEPSSNEVPFELIDNDLTENTLQELDDGYFDITQKDPYRNVIGKAFGIAIWLQGDETPDCCHTPMRFILQLEEQAEMNFGGGGISYLFGCDKCHNHKFLWQC